MSDFDINRRRLLGVMGATGIATFAGLGYATGDSVRYTMASSHSCPDYTLNAEWRETYTRDGQTTLLENTTASSDEDTGTEDTVDSAPMNIHLQNVLPGDRGTVSFRLTADKKTNDANNSVTPTLGLDLTGRAENGVNDPEREAGDTSSGGQEGELQDKLQVKVWENTGILGIDALGADDLKNDLTEPTIAEGTLARVATELNNEPLGNIDATQDDPVSVTLRWEFTDPAAVNVTQTDSVTFTLDIGCG